MKISELTKLLGKIRREHGDLHIMLEHEDFLCDVDFAVYSSSDGTVILGMDS